MHTCVGLFTHMETTHTERKPHICSIISPWITEISLTEQCFRRTHVKCIIRKGPLPLDHLTCLPKAILSPLFPLVPHFSLFLCALPMTKERKSNDNELLIK